MEPISDRTLEGLTKCILEQSTIISKCISENDLPHLSLEAGGPSEFPVPLSFQAVHAARFKLLAATQLLTKLAWGPSDAVRFMSLSHHDCSALRSIYRFNIAQAVPPTGDISYHDVAQKIGLDEDITRRVIQFATTNGIFKPSRPGFVSHSAMSKALLEDEYLQAWIGHNTEDVFPASCSNTDALTKWPVNDGSPSKVGLNVAFDTDRTFFGFIENDPMRGERFGKAMKALSLPGSPYEASNLPKTFDFSKLGEATVVDVGGSRGHASIAIAEAHPLLKFIIQDYAPVLKSGQAELPPKLTPRFEWMPFDFFQPQPDLSSRGNVAYLMRFILHDWSDQYCLKILRNFVPVLNDKSTILINENILAPIGSINQTLERNSRLLDMQMMAVCNSKERTADDWEHLFTEADQRFKMVHIHTLPGNPVNVIEFRFDKEEE